jgi:hypothetical protein
MQKTRVLALFAVTLAACCCVSAQDYPRYELSAGYSYGNVNTQGYSTQRDAQGWNGSIVANFKRWVGVETEVSGRYNTMSFAFQGNSLTYNSAYYSFLAGPRLARRRGKATPFVHGLFGIERAPSYDNTVIDPATSLATTPYGTGLASAAGGGVDYAFSRHLAFRTQADYFFTRYNTALTPNPNNFRVLAAVVFTFGGADPVFSARKTPRKSATAPAVAASQPTIPQPSTDMDAAAAIVTPVQAATPAAPAPVEVQANSLNRTVSNDFQASVQAPVVKPMVEAPVAASVQVKPAPIQPAPVPVVNGVAAVRPVASSPKPVVSQPAPVQPAQIAVSASDLAAQNTVVISSGSTAAQLQASNQVEESLGDVARRYRNKKQGTANTTQSGF